MVPKYSGANTKEYPEILNHTIHANKGLLTKKISHYWVGRGEKKRQGCRVQGAGGKEKKNITCIN
jgi:hypothetical protein